MIGILSDNDVIMDAHEFMLIIIKAYFIYVSCATIMKSRVSHTMSTCLGI